MQGDHLILISENGFVYTLEELSFANGAGSLLGQVVNAKHHVLGRHCHGAAVGRLQEVVGGQEQETTLCLCLNGQRKMHCHLVAVEVRVECGTYKGMQLNCLTLYQNGLKCLNTKSVKCRCTVQHYGMLLDHLFEDVPNLGVQSLHKLLCVLNVLADALCHQLLHNEGLEQLDGHLLGKTALIDLQLGTYHDNGTTRVVYTLTKKVLTETSGLTLQHVRQGLQRSVSRAGNGSAATTVVDQGIHCLLEHSLLVAHDDVGRAEL